MSTKRKGDDGLSSKEPSKKKSKKQSSSSSSKRRRGGGKSVDFPINQSTRRSNMGKLLTGIKPDIPELKYVDTMSGVGSWATIPFDNTYNSAPQNHAYGLNVIKLGTDGWNRIGKTIRIRRCLFRGVIRPIAACNPINDIFRIALVWDANPYVTGAVPTTINVWKTIRADTGAQQTDELAFKFDTVNPQYTVLRERNIPIIQSLFATGAPANPPVWTNYANQSLTETNQGRMMIEWDVVFPEGTYSHFNNTNGGTYADLQQGGLSILATGFNSGTAQFNLVWCARVYFDDC